jgi:hypothetical protein
VLLILSAGTAAAAVLHPQIPLQRFGGRRRHSGLGAAADGQATAAARRQTAEQVAVAAFFCEWTKSFKVLKSCDEVVKFNYERKYLRRFT